jgi:hypothetical protein
MIRSAIAAISILFCCSTVALSATCGPADSVIRVKNFRVWHAPTSSWREYVEFKLKKPTAFTLSVTAATGPFTHLTSGNPVPVNGALFTKVMIGSVFWTCSIPKIILVKPIVKDVQSIEQFEGQVGYIIGRSAGSNYLFTQNVNCNTGANRCVRVWYKP